MEGFSSIARVLGLPALEAAAQTPLGLVARIEGGLPLQALDRVSRLVAPSDSQFKYRIVSKATYDRRRSTKRMSSDEGVRLSRLARVWGLAVDVWKDEDETRRFLFRPHAMLDDERPIDVVLRSEIGAELVVEILGGLKYGVAV